MAHKGNLWLLVSFALLAGGSAGGSVTGIQVVSEEHHVWGFAGSDTDWTPGGNQESYDQTAPNPLDVSVTGTYIDSWGPCTLTSRSVTGDFHVETHATYWFSRAYAQSSYLFTPQAGVDALTFGLVGSGCGVGIPDETNIQFTLDDLTAEGTLASLTAPSSIDDWGGPMSPSSWSVASDTTYDVDPTHTYCLTLYACAGGGDGWRDTYGDVSVQAVIPAPGALLLSVIGAACVGWTRRHTVR